MCAKASKGPIVKIACPSCSAKYSIADEKVQNRLAKIRCRKCGTTIVIDGKASPPTVQAAGSSVHPQAASVSHAPSASVGPGVASYTVDISEHDQRTMTVPELVDAYNTGVVTADTYVWKDGMADWAPLADVPEINDALHAAAAASQPPVAAAAFGQAEPQEPVRAAARADHKADLFGGIDMAGSERDVSVQHGQTEDAAVTTATTGARNESSVLFSLSALTGGGQDAPAPAAPQGGVTYGGASTEDSGLIDLAALTAAAEATDPSQSMDLGSSPLAASPLGAAPLTGGTTAPLGGLESQIPPPSSSKNGLFIGGGIAVAAVVGGLVFLLKEEPPPAPAVPPPPATVVVTATVEVPSAEKPDEEQAAEEDEKEKAKTPTQPKRKYTAKPSPKPKSSPTPKPSEASPSPKPKPKPKSKCNCKPNDLMCAMKCSTK